MSEDRENHEGATAGDSLLQPDESRDNIPTVASPSGKAEVKYVNADSQNGDAKIDLGDVREKDKTFAGMGKEELMRFANDPFWVRTRWILFALFWLLWLAMLTGAIAIIVLAPRCSSPKKAQWWERSPLYEVNVRSFKDGLRMADGVGDFQGMLSTVDHLKDLGVSGVILSSIYPTGKQQSAESVTDFKSVHPDFGTLDEFKDLVAAMKAKDLRVVLDLVPNHSGKEHKWFQDSVKKIAPYKDYYVWNAGKGSKDTPPNNWKSVTGGSAWEWNEERNEFYLHQFEAGQPDLNFRNPAVKEEFNSIFKFWLDLGVSGFQLRKTALLVEDLNLRDEAHGSKPGTTHNSYDFYDHKYTSFLHDSFKLVAQWRSVVSNNSEDRLFLIRDEFPIEDFTLSGTVDNSTAAAGDLLQTPKFLQSVTSNINVVSLSNSIRSAIDRSPSHKPVWSLGGGESQRLASKFSGGLADAMMMLILLLPGTPLLFYGDEIGLKDAPGSPATQSLAPMQWNSSTNAGFTSDSIKPWLTFANPLNNVAAQREAADSHLKVVKELIELRKATVAIMQGKTNITVLNATRADGTVVPNSILAFTRIKSGNPGVLVAVNPSKEELTVNFKTIDGVTESGELTVGVKTSGFSNKDLPKKTPGDAVKLPAESGLTLTFVYKEKEK